MGGNGGDILKSNYLPFVEGRLPLKSRSDFLAVILQQTALIWLKWLTYFLSGRLI